MLFLKALTLFCILPASILALPVDVEKRQSAEAVLAAIMVIVMGVNDLTAALSNFDGGYFNVKKAMAVQQATMDLSNDLTSATTAAISSPMFDDAQSIAVGTALLNLEPQLNSVLDLVISKKTDFDKVAGKFSLRKTVLDGLMEQKMQSAQFGAAVTSKLTPIAAAQAPAVNARIAAKFDTAIAAYEQKGKGIPLPAMSGMI